VRSEVEWEFVKIHIAWNCADFGSESSYLVGKHTWCWYLNRVVPVVVVVAQGVGEVKDCHLGDLRRVLGYVEVSWLHRTLGHRVRHKEEIELAVDDF